MKPFIEDYLQDPTAAIAAAHQSAQESAWSENIDEDMIYAQIASPQFRLYETIVF